MARLPRAEAPVAPAWAWLLGLPAAWRTSMATALLLGSFAASFWLSGPAQPTAALASNSLDAVPQAELVDYLLSSGTRVENTDLAVLTAANPSLTSSFMQASESELSEVLDAQPSEEALYL